MPRCARSETVFYASHNWHPFFLHGTKTLAYELWEDLGFRAPDNIITPCGAGSNVLGCEIGFSELLRAGEIDAMPRIFAAQPANCAPIAAAFLAGSDAPVATEIRPTIAEGTAIAQPIRLAEVLGTLRADARRRGDAERGGDRQPPRSIWRASASMSSRPAAQAAAAFAQAARRRHDHAGADHGAGADRQRPEGDAADRRAAGGDAVSGGRTLLVRGGRNSNTPPPLAGGGWGEGTGDAGLAHAPPPPNPLPQGEGEN